MKPNEGSIGRCFNFQPGEKFYLIFGKVSSVILGLLCIGFAYIASQLGGILEASLRYLTHNSIQVVYLIWSIWYSMGNMDNIIFVIRNKVSIT